MLNTRQLYPDFLRASSITKIVIFHFFGYQILTYIPALGIMFALGGWFVANSLHNKPAHHVIFNRLTRLLPIWWTFALLTLIGGFFYAQGANLPFDVPLAWLFPYEQVTLNIDTAYATDATVVTWYISTYLWLMLLSPILLYVYKKLSWVAIFIPVIAMIIYTQLFPIQQTVFGENWFDVLTFSGCWLLGFSKADNSINNIPRYLIWLTAGVCVGCGFFLTWDAQTLTGNPIATSVMSFGVAMLLLSFNPDLSSLPQWLKHIIRTVNTYAVTIYLFHNILIDGAYKIGDYLNVYTFGGPIGNHLCFIILIGMIYCTVKTIGIVETHKWFKKTE